MPEFEGPNHPRHLVSGLISGLEQARKEWQLLTARQKAEKYEESKARQKQRVEQREALNWLLGERR